MSARISESLLIGIASSGKVGRVIAFEPTPACVKSCLKSVELNKLKNVDVRQLILKESKEAVRFDTTSEDANGHSIFDSPSEGEVIFSSTIDDEIQQSKGISVFQIDVEGAEVLVMKEGRNFINENLPFIISEYNFVSKRHFSLGDIRKQLPNGYEIFRLRSEDGFLDENLEQTWNCVAVHKNSPFYPVAHKLIK